MNPYEVLGINKKASPASIRKAYRKLAARHHPDRNPGDSESEARYRAATEAYEVLIDPQRREQYDTHGTTALPKNTVDGEMLSVLVPTLLSVLHEVARQGKVKETDIVGKMHEMVVGYIQGTELSLAAVEKGRNALQAAQGRFIIADLADNEENLLEAAVRNKIKEVDGEINKARYELDKLSRVKKYLNRCKYKLDEGLADMMKASASWYGVSQSSRTSTSPGFTKILMEPIKDIEDGDDD